jgi:hypothetical protein
VATTKFSADGIVENSETYKQKKGKQNQKTTNERSFFLYSVFKEVICPSMNRILAFYSLKKHGRMLMDFALAVLTSESETISN